MAIEDKKYEELMTAVNALLRTGRQEMVRGWLIRLAFDILRYYGYTIAPQDGEQVDKSSST